MRLKMIHIILILFLSLNLNPVSGSESATNLSEDGYSLWLRYCYIEDDLMREDYLSYFEDVTIQGNTPTYKVIQDELSKAFKGFFRKDLTFGDQLRGAGQLKFTLVKEGNPLFLRFRKMKKESYLIQTNSLNRSIHISSLTEAGLLYGTFHLLRLLQNRESLHNLSIMESPALDLRMLNQWDNLDGTVERGYSGRSIYKWDELPEGDLSRYRDFARANASLGINAVAINNVNADPNILRPEYLRKVQKLADLFRAYNIRIFLSANFASPMEPSSTPNTLKKWGGIGELNKSDPLDELVIAWWSNKIEEVYAKIPDFGGFLVKANSEGMPGPQDYGRSHAEGANMFARLLKPYGGIVIWRAFVYSHHSDEIDRVKQAYQEFKPLDGLFDDNVLLQIKNGPLDFQPSEPPSPLFGAMDQTTLIPELQITQEYLGHSTYLVYLGEMWEKFFRFETYHPEFTPSTIADLVMSERQKLTGVAGVANVGDDRNWTGHHFAQANWFLFGRMAWNPKTNVERVTDEWISMTWSHDAEVSKTIHSIMEGSLSNFIDLQTPFGMPVTVCRAKHYDPSFPSRNGSYWRADNAGIGHDRSSTGSDFVSQYHAGNRDLFNDMASCPEAYLLFFHFVPWNYRIDGKGTIYEMILRRNRESITHLTNMRNQWNTLNDRIDSQRHSEVSHRMDMQLKHGKTFHSHVNLFIRDINSN